MNKYNSGQNSSLGYYDRNETISTLPDLLQETQDSIDSTQAKPFSIKPKRLKVSNDTLKSRVLVVSPFGQINAYLELKREFSEIEKRVLFEHPISRVIDYYGFRNFYQGKDVVYLKSRIKITSSEPDLSMPRDKDGNDEPDKISITPIIDNLEADLIRLSQKDHRLKLFSVNDFN